MNRPFCVKVIFAIGGIFAVLLDVEMDIHPITAEYIIAEAMIAEASKSLCCTAIIAWVHYWQGCCTRDYLRAGAARVRIGTRVRGSACASLTRRLWEPTYPQVIHNPVHKLCITLARLAKPACTVVTACNA